jgi:hypothetical protein
MKTSLAWNNGGDRAQRNRFANVVLLLCLFAPSVRMIATIPPLWRDADAYTQLTQPPLVSVFWNHSPAYCYLAKVPLYIGEKIEQWQRHEPPPRLTDPSQPAVTDTGVWILIVAQHLALGLAAFLFITAVTPLFWIRLGLSVLWASNAMPYTFAHCVGSETLGLILALLLVWRALRLVQSEEEPSWKDWYWIALLLLLCILARDLNLALLALLPLTFLISWLLKVVTKEKNPRFRPAFDLRQAVIAIAIGVTCNFVSDSVEQNLARKTKLHPHSRIGFTFFWRLHFLGELSPESRAAVLQKVKARAPTERVRYLLTLLEQIYDEHGNVAHPGPFMNRAIGYFGGQFHWEDLDRALNQMAFTFLFPPPPELLKAAKADFVQGMRGGSTVVSDELFEATTVYFSDKDGMPALKNLVTFRDTSADKIQQLASEYRYFQLWKGLSYVGALALWFVCLLLLVVISKRKRIETTILVAYAIALVPVGLVQFVVSSLVHDYAPRLSLAMWQLWTVSLFVLVANIVECLLLPQRRAKEKVRRAAVRPEP